MKTNKFIIWSMISITLTSCSYKNYRIITQVYRDGSCRVEIPFIADSLSAGTFSYYHSSGWEISQTDTLVKDGISMKDRKCIKISKIFPSVGQISADTTVQGTYLIPKESLEKRFRWFYTYYVFTAIYPEVANKGCVPLDQYLNKAEQKFLLQGDISAYRGMNGFEMKEELENIEAGFWEWHFRSMYEESFDAILQYAGTDFRLQLPAIKDSLYSINKSRIEKEYPTPEETCKWLDRFFSTDHFSKVYTQNKNEIDDILEEKSKETDELVKHVFQYELILPGKLMATNADQQNDETLIWKINMFKFLADDYTLTAESRTANIWAFAVTLLLIAFSGYCFIRYFR